jgi:hypothetical protein
MDLAPLHFMLSEQLLRCESAFKNALALNGPLDEVRRRHLLEGVLSDAWQYYCSFVRNLIIRSATGCNTSHGVVHLASIVPNCWQRASFVAIKSAKGVAIPAAGLNSLLRKEPTWGDSSKILLIVPALNPGNAMNLISHLASGLNGPKHCQIVRNACAHKNLQTKAEVQNLATTYIATSIKYPTDALTWREPGTQQYAFLSWLDDMRLIAEGAVS